MAKNERLSEIIIALFMLKLERRKLAMRLDTKGVNNDNIHKQDEKLVGRMKKLWEERRGLHGKQNQSAVNKGE